MKKIKIFLILFIVIFLSGCTGVYELTINEDLSVIESANFSLKQETDTYDKVIELLKEYDVAEKDYTINSTDNVVKVTFSKRFLSFEDYILNSKLYPHFMNEINYTNDGKFLSIDTDAIFSSGIKDNDNIYNNQNIDLLKINVKTHLNVMEDNSDEDIYETYSWNIKNGDTKKEIKLKISTASFKQNIKYIIILLVIGLIVISFAVLAFIRFRKAKKI